MKQYSGGNADDYQVTDSKAAHKKNSGQAGRGNAHAQESAASLLRVFLLFLLIFTAALVPAQMGLAKLGHTQVFGPAEENLLENMNTLVSEDSAFYEEFSNSDRVNVLLMGTNDNLADTLMVASYDTKKQQIDLISIPRDTYYYREEYASSPGYLKINSIWQYENIIETAEAVSDVLQGMPINYYLHVDYEGVERIVDGVGGVPVTIDFHMYYNDPYDTPELHIDFEPGDHVLNGQEAMEYLRFRKGDSGYPGYPDGDIGRVRAQQQFMVSAFKQAMSYGLVKTAGLVIDNVDSDVTVGFMSKVATHALGFDSEKITTYMLPGEPQTKHGASYWVQNEAETVKMLDAIYNGPPEEENTATDGAVESGEANGETAE